MKLSLVTYPDPILTTKCQPVELVKGKVPNEVVELSKHMLDLMYDSNGVGLAANQVGHSLRILVMDCGPFRNSPTVLINPEIVTGSAKVVRLPEGCLSLPGKVHYVSRPEKVQIRAVDENGSPVSAHLDGLWARCVQHEIDHLDGKFFTEI